MPSAFDTEFARTCRSEHQRHHGEQVWYLPLGDQASARAISARVNRDPRDDYPGTRSGTAPFANIRVDNSNVTGISGAELDTGRDKIVYAIRVMGDETAEPADVAAALALSYWEARTIRTITTQTAQSLDLEVR